MSQIYTLNWRGRGNLKAQKSLLPPGVKVIDHGPSGLWTRVKTDLPREDLVALMTGKASVAVNHQSE